MNKLRREIPIAPSHYVYTDYALFPLNVASIKYLVCAGNSNVHHTNIFPLIERTSYIIEEIKNFERQDVDLLELICRELSVTHSMNSEGLASVLSYAIQVGSGIKINQAEYNVESPDLAQYVEQDGLNSADHMANFLANYGRKVDPVNGGTLVDFWVSMVRK
ncbi:MAG TPA: hypothetical protein PK957_02835 [Candidatus Dojkabacteria bacterium]|nr:hypothetical protein [Candidatus Dojkabacteria bacterium]HQF36927.1 hypothetical protein [Candidatus Dojkabacteria bacterium]